MNRAAMRCDEGRVEAEIAAGDDVIDGDEFGARPLELAIIHETAGDRLCLPTIEVLLGAGADATRVVDGQTMLVWAARFQVEAGVVLALGEAGADPCQAATSGEFAGMSLVEVGMATERPAEVMEVLHQLDATCEVSG